MIQLKRTKEVVQTVVEDYSFDDFFQLIKQFKPEEIFNELYSKTEPLYHVLNYDEGSLKYYSHLNKTPKWATLKEFYAMLSQSGVRYFYFQVEDNKPIEG